MTPYHQDGQITLYHGDAYSLPRPSADMLLTDPPYGIGLTWGGIRNRNMLNAETVTGDDEPFDPRPWLDYPKVCLFGANHFAHLLPASGGWIAWDKTIRADAASVMADGELAWTNFTGKVRFFRHLWNGGYRASERGFHVHPTQKPVSLMRWIIDTWTKPGDVVFDPFMGSGPVARACKDLGRGYIGVEIDERYCEIAAQRLAQGALNFGEVAS